MMIDAEFSCFIVFSWVIVGVTIWLYNLTCTCYYCLFVIFTIRIQIRDPDRHQNFIICSLVHCQSSLKISCKSVQKFLRNVANRQTDKQTDRQTTTIT